MRLTKAASGMYWLTAKSKNPQKIAIIKSFKRSILIIQAKKYHL